MNLQWMNWADSSRLILQGSLRLTLFGLKSNDCFPINITVIRQLTHHYRWGQANAMRGQGGVGPEDVYGTRI